MTRRTTVITPTTQQDALYELPSQPFARRVVSASLYAITQAAFAVTQPELKIRDVEGNVLFTASAQVIGFQTYSVQWACNTSGVDAQFLLSSFVYLSPGGAYFPSIIGEDCFVPASNLLTVTLYGSLPADTLPNLVLVTEDADEDFMP